MRGLGITNPPCPPKTIYKCKDQTSNIPKLYLLGSPGFHFHIVLHKIIVCHSVDVKITYVLSSRHVFVRVCLRSKVPSGPRDNGEDPQQKRNTDGTIRAFQRASLWGDRPPPFIYNNSYTIIRCTIGYPLSLPIMVRWE